MNAITALASGKIVQNHRSRPKSYKHYIKVERQLFLDLINVGIIDAEHHITEGSAFFEFDNDIVTISSRTYWCIEDIHIRILDYLVRKAYGKSLVERGGIMF